MDCRMDIAKKSNNMLKLLFTNLFFLDQKSKKKPQETTTWQAGIVCSLHW